jgi:hypothetical protein
MPHNIHALERSVERLSSPAMERAMLLYNDSTLTRTIIANAKLPDDNQDVAIALSPGEKPEHAIFSRSGSMVTNLAAGWPYHDAHLISHDYLLNLIERMGDVRQRFAAAEKLTGKHCAAGQFLSRLIFTGRYLSQEEFVAVSFWQPLLRDLLLSLFRISAHELHMQRQVFRRLHEKRLEQRGEVPLRRYWEKSFFLWHAALLITMDRHHSTDALSLTPEQVYELVSTTLLFEQGTLGGMLRVAWVAGELSKDILGVVKQRFTNSKGDDPWATFESAVALLAIASRRPGRYAEIDQVLDGPFLKLAASGITGAAVLHHHLRVAFAQLRTPQADQTLTWMIEASRLLQSQRQGVEHQPPPVAPVPTIENLAHLPAAVAGSTRSLIAPQVIELGVLAIPHCMKLKPKDFYLPAEQLATIQRTWQPKATMSLLATQESVIGKPQPVKNPNAKIGRNDPCSCKSGKKYKFCHGA